MKKSGHLWPVADARVKYRHVPTFEQHARMRVHIKEFENRLRTGYQIFGVEADKCVTTEHTIQVAVNE